MKAADDSSPIDAADAFRASMRHAVAEGVSKIEHCLRQLEDAQVWWRPAPEMNSIANLLLHVSGNLRQWIVVTVGGAAAVHRDRQAEFDDRSHRPKAELLAVLKRSAAEVDAVLASLSENDLLKRVTVQGYHTHAAGAVTHSVTHLCGHVQEMIHMTRVQLRAGYRFDLSL